MVKTETIKQTGRSIGKNASGKPMVVPQFSPLPSSPVATRWSFPENFQHAAVQRSAAVQVGMQALMMRSEWFAVGRSGAEGPREEHFLWRLGQGPPGDGDTWMIIPLSKWLVTKLVSYL